LPILDPTSNATLVNDPSDTTPPVITLGAFSETPNRSIQKYEPGIGVTLLVPPSF
jgi:hypothetical protein